MATVENDPFNWFTNISDAWGSTLHWGYDVQNTISGGALGIISSPITWLIVGGIILILLLK